MYEKQKADKFLDGLKHSHFIGLRSMILCNQKMRNDFNATAEHVKDMVNRTPTLKNPPGRQVSDIGRGGGRGRGTDRGGREGHGGRGGRGYYSGRGHGGVAITKTDIVIAPQAHTPLGLTNSLTKMPLTA